MSSNDVSTANEMLNPPRKTLIESHQNSSTGNEGVKRGRGRPRKNNSSIKISCDFDCQESVLLNVTMKHSPSKNNSKKDKKVFRLKKRQGDDHQVCSKVQNLHIKIRPEEEEQEIPNDHEDEADESQDFAIDPSFGSLPDAIPDVFPTNEEVGYEFVKVENDKSPVKRGRGRPPKRKLLTKSEEQNDEAFDKLLNLNLSPIKKERVQTPDPAQESQTRVDDSSKVPEDKSDKNVINSEVQSKPESEVKRGRGRPPKSLTNSKLIQLQKTLSTVTKIKKVKLKTKPTNTTSVIENAKEAKRGRGRPPKVQSDSKLEIKAEPKLEVKRGRPPKKEKGHRRFFKKAKVVAKKGGSTTKISKIKKLFKDRKVKKEDSDSNSYSNSTEEVEESCDEIQKYMKTLGLIPANTVSGEDGQDEEVKKKRGRPRKMILTKFQMKKKKDNYEELQKRNEEMSREIWELSKINADLQNRLNYVPFLQEENHRLHVALNEQKQKFEELSRQCGVQIPNYEYEENLIPEVILEDANEDTLQIQDDIKM